ncbi:MAG: hypothetical protein K2V38_22040, partial [Gemmataceae bacterium]|nr:hypothetical protein [Gemmataceae bacterium]
MTPELFPTHQLPVSSPDDRPTTLPPSAVSDSADLPTCRVAVPESDHLPTSQIAGSSASATDPPGGPRRSWHFGSETPTRQGTPAAADAFPRPGEFFEGFELLSELGRGAMGRVFLARQPAPALRVVVLKVGQHLSSECQKLAKLQHPNVVPVYSFHQAAGSRQAVCMPYRGPLTLAHVVARLRSADLQTFDGLTLTTVIEECRKVRQPTVEVLDRVPAPAAAPAP